MENNKSSGRIHPLVAGAAISVMLVSLTGVAALTGLIPSSHSSNSPEAATENTSASSAQSPVAASVGAAASAASPSNLVDSKAVESRSKTEETPLAESKPAPAPHRSHTTHTAKATQSTSRPSYAESTVAAQAPEICSTCGRIESVQAIPHAAKPSGLGVAAGAVLGGILGNQVGNGNGRTLATIAGAVGGGYAGNEVEKRSHTATTYQVRVRMDDGSIRTFPYTQQPSWNAGDRARVVDGQLTARG